ncbi:hypothetical protein MUK42_34804 [Musa troglodytarum]|uniref:Uncharacterized protein n=1 Tax=Musa troglodytarum TaxID=320322 RepID=A0A9E7H6T9_9LILI|nr:hypothetical protein MUK42_34804 [Musa troglodytarum]
MYDAAAAANLLERDRRTGEVGVEEFLQADGSIEVDVGVDEGTAKKKKKKNLRGWESRWLSEHRAKWPAGSIDPTSSSRRTPEEHDSGGGGGGWRDGPAPGPLVGTNTLASTRCRSGDGQL